MPPDCFAQRPPFSLPAGQRVFSWLLELGDYFLLNDVAILAQREPAQEIR
jgi:hypothetical protein